METHKITITTEASTVHHDAQDTDSHVACWYVPARELSHPSFVAIVIGPLQGYISMAQVSTLYHGLAGAIRKDVVANAAPVADPS